MHKRSNPDTLLLDYESGGRRKIQFAGSGFIGFGDEEDRIQIAIEQSSLAFMSANGDKYDDSFCVRTETNHLPRTPVAPGVAVSHHKKRVSWRFDVSRI